MDINHAYTNEDHLARENDAYALSKYWITLRWLSEHLTIRKPHVVNVGAGSGVFAGLATQPGWTVTNIEPDASAAALAEERLGEGSVLRADLFTYSPELPADVLVMHDVLEHIEDDSAAVARVHALLGGGSRPAWFIGSVPAWQWLFGYHDHQLGHYRRYSPKMLRTTIGSHFEIRHLRQLGLLGIPAALWFSRIRQEPYPVGSGGAMERIFGLPCRVEERLPPPIGSSLLFAAMPIKLPR